MKLSRRDFAKLALAGAPAAAALSHLQTTSLVAAERPNSMVHGVQLGVITYSYRSMRDTTAKALLGYIVANGISATELMGDPAEEFAGAPSNGRGRGGRGRGEPTPEQLAARRDAREALRRWRTGVSMDKYKQLRQLYEDAGVKIYALESRPRRT